MARQQNTAAKQPSPHTIAIVVFIAAAVASYLMISAFYGSTGGNFSAFKSSFGSAQRVAIYAAAYNSFGSTGTCANRLITSIIANAHRNSSTIDYFIVNQTSCIYVKNLGTPVPNSTTTTFGRCLNISKAEPTVYINYSVMNTTLIRPDYLYTAGDRLFLSECGIAAELG